jgi:hypothetical protein
VDCDALPDDERERLKDFVKGRQTDMPVRATAPHLCSTHRYRWGLDRFLTNSDKRVHLVGSVRSIPNANGVNVEGDRSTGTG